MNVLRTLGNELFAVSQETSILKAKCYESGCEGLAERLHCIMRNHVVGGLADGPLGTPAPRLPRDLLLNRLLLGARDLGRPLWSSGGSVCSTPPQGLRILTLEFGLGVTFWSLPLSATWNDGRSIFKGLLTSAFASLGFSSPSIQRGHLKTQISLVVQLLSSFLGESQARIGVCRPWVIGPADFTPSSPALLVSTTQPRGPSHHPFMLLMFIEHPLCVKHCSGH